MAAAALGLWSGAAVAQSARTQAALEIVGSAGTAAIYSALGQFSLTTGMPPQGEPGRPVALGRTSTLGTGAMDSAFVASINNFEDSGATDLASGIQSDRSTRSRERGNNLILAQYN
ncbi:hypothetical protein ACOYW6_07760 [Parablastomonas sp. CN1-191]|uniref:hypothetical protein n=1 Tax=Parablastomonas sp. CN1-191 TaxID=3400908 RepID=UPI003BF804EC